MSDESARDVSFGLEVSKGFVAKLLQAALGFAGTVIFARALGPTDFGGYYLLLSVIGLAERPIVGFSGATRKRFAESGTARTEIVGLQLVLNAVFVVAMAVGAMLFDGLLRSYTGLSDAGVFFFVLITGLTLFTTLQGFLASLGRVGVQTWIDTLRSVLTLGFQLALVLVGWAVAGMVAGLFLATVLMLPLTYYYLRTLPTLPSRETVASVWSFARYSIPATFVGKAYDRFDILLLGLVASPMAAAWYEVAYKLTVPAMFVAGLVSSGLMAKVSDAVSRRESAAEDIKNALAFASTLSIPIFFGALAIPRRLVVTAYGPGYEEAAVLLVGLALYRVIQTQTDVLVGLLQGLDRPDVQVRVSAVALVVNVVLGVGLYFRLGPIGVVLATVAAEAIRYVAFFRSASREVSVPLFQRAVLEEIVAGTVMYLVVDTVSNAIGIQSWQGLSLVVGSGGVVYFLVLFAISYHFRSTVRGLIAQVVAASPRP